MKRKITALFVAAFLAANVSIAQNFTAVYDFDSVKTNSGLTDPTPLPTVTNVTFGAFTAVGTPANPNATARFSFTNWPVGATNGINVYDSLSGSIDTTQYYEVTVTPNSGYSIDLSSITFSVQRSGTGIRTYAVRSSADNYASNLTPLIVPANTNLDIYPGGVFFWNTDATTSNQNGSTISLTGPGYTNLTTAVTFRFYGWNAESSGGTFSIDNVTINGSVNGMITAQYTANNVCEGDSIHFMDMSTAVMNIISWDWNFGIGSPTDSVQNPVHYFANPGMYLVTLTVTDDSSNTDSYTDTVYVYPKPLSSWVISTSGTGICVGTNVSFTDVSTISGGSISGYAWNFGDPGSGANNTSALQSPSHVFAAAGVYSVSQIVTSDMGCKDTSDASVTISAYPVAAFSFTDSASTVTYTDLSTGGVTTWYWDFGDYLSGDSSVIQNPTYTYTVADIPVTACLTVTNAAGCSDSVCEVIYTVSINEAGSKILTTVYPSPSEDGIFTIYMESVSENTVATVYNVIGKAVYTKRLRNNKETIDLSGQSNGSYFLNIKNDEESTIRKIIINK
ncbi:MAG: PKD domain-containing protein [Bacteroidia bacterium]|jgi:PKD repeat protein